MIFITAASLNQALCATVNGAVSRQRSRPTAIQRIGANHHEDALRLQQGARFAGDMCDVLIHDGAHGVNIARADKKLDPRTAKTLAKIFDTAYREMTES